MVLKFPKHVDEHDEDDEIVTFCADGKVIWRSEIEAIMAGKPIERLKRSRAAKRRKMMRLTGRKNDGG